MYNRDRRVTGPGILIGLWITTLGVIFLLDQLGLVPAHLSFQFVWPGILIALGLGGVFSNNPGYRFWGAVLLTWGALSLSNVLGLMHFRFASLWPLILIALGVAMLLNSSGRLSHPMGWSNRPGSSPDPTGHPASDPTANPVQDPARDASPDPTRSSFSSAPHVGPTGFPPGGAPTASFFGVDTGGGNTDSATFDQSVILSGFKRRVTSQRFRYGKVTAILGGFHLDLTRADIDGNQAVLHIDTVFGGGEVRVPDTWRITIEATAVAGAFVDETYPQPVAGSAPVKQLVVRGAAIFGGVNIKN